MSFMRNMVRIVEVGPRDGLQNISTHVPTAIKRELIQRLISARFRTVEVTSIVSPKAIPQLADHEKILTDPLLKSHFQRPDIRLPVLVPNVKGFKRALDLGVKEIAVFISASEGFSKANVNCTVEQGIARATEVSRAAGASGVLVRGYVSCIFACPYDGPIAPTSVLKCVQSLLGAGCYEVSLGDTTGVGTPGQTLELVSFLLENGIPSHQLAGHFHDTYGQALANAWEAYRCGIRVFDSSVAGLGGCPFAPGARGNLASEDLVYMFESSGIPTGVDLDRLADVGDWISQQLKLPNWSRAGAALLTKKRISSQKGAKNQGSAIGGFQWKEESNTGGLVIMRDTKTVKLILDRPKNGNALTASMISQLTQFFESCKHDASISRIILTANGKFFCTGMDLSKENSPVGKGGNATTDQFALLTNLFQSIDDAPQVTIASINGPCFGGGVGLALACDIRIAAPDASITLSETRLGLAAATISKYVIRELGIPFAREAFLSARAITAAELKQRGVVAIVADNPGTLDQTTENYAFSLRQCAPRASEMSKELVKLAWKAPGSEMQDTGIRGIFKDMMRPGSEGSKGLAAFQAGRKKLDWDLVGEPQKSKL